MKIVQNLEFYVHLNDHQFEGMLHWLTAISARDEMEINKLACEVYERYYDADGQKIASTTLFDQTGEWIIWLYNPKKDRSTVQFYWPGKQEKIDE